MQIQPETIIWNQPSTVSKPVQKNEVFRLSKSLDDRINGSIPVWDKPKTPEEDISAGLSQATKTKAPKFATALAEAEQPKDESFGFLDVLDMINPLQHIPVIGSIYRSITGDQIGPAARVVGGAAFGGPIGAASGIVNALVQMETGKDVTDNMVASFTGDDHPAAPEDTTIALANLKAPQRSYNS